jgi:hypothetical protein
VRQLAKIIELHAEQLFPNSWQHPRYSHTSQLVIWYVQREAHAFCLSEPPEELYCCVIVPLPQGSWINLLFLITANEIMSMKLLLQILPGAN